MQLRYNLSSLVLLLLLFVPVMADTSLAQTRDVIYDESFVPEYALPELLRMQDGSSVETAQRWRDARRAEIYRLFEREMFGRAPARPDSLLFELLESGQAFGGTAERRQVRIHLSPQADAAAIDVLLYVPADREGTVPVFVGLNFQGNHTINADPNILLRRPFTGPDGALDTASESERGSTAGRWPVEALIARGFGLVTAFYGDIDPDFDDGFQNGVHTLFQEPDQNKRAPDEWGSIAAWAWGLSRMMDYLEADSAVDEEAVVLMGHSRLGKAALWAGASDPRFQFVISNNSGEGGAAITRRRFGETIALINERFPHWFAENFKAYADREDDVPFDMHMLLALIAPRPLYVASAVEDRWADPRGEFLAALHADPVYRLLAGEGLDATEMPAVDEPVLSRIGYHIRSGGHDVTRYDWDRWMDWVALHR